MNISPLQLVIGVLLAILVAYGAWRLKALSRSGAAATAVLGAIVFGVGGIRWAVLILLFFISSSLLSRLFVRRKSGLSEKFSKGHQRDAGQVLANGGVAGFFTLLTLVFPESPWVWAGFAGSLAAANADTWATELGVLSPTLPRLITTGQTVESGTSGAISPFGTLAAAAGSLLIALFAALLWPAAAPAGFGMFVLRLALVLLAGVAGSLVDSLLGATFQAIYFCPTCFKETERHPVHTCGTPTQLNRGLPWLDNDVVNGACTLAGALVAAILAALLTLATSPVGQITQTPTLPLTSPAFLPGSSIPVEYTCDGANGSPALEWGNLPANTRSLALIVEDPDAPVGLFTHWVLYNLPPTLTGLPAGVPAEGLGTPGTTSFNQPGYGGPCPPAGKPHRYFFKLYALNLDPTLPAGLDRNGLLKAINGHVLASGELVGLYARQK